MQRPPIVITGMGLATSLGLSPEATWQSIIEGKCGIGPMPALEQPAPLTKGGGQAIDLPADFMCEAPREVRYLRWTILQALRQAGAEGSLPYPSQRCGVLLGTTLHGMRAAGQFLRSGDYAPLENFLAGSTLRLALNGLELGGFAATTCSACSSSLGSIALAVTLLQAGELDLVIAGGYDTVSEYVYAGFNSLRLVADGPLRPFARGRQGMKLAEGYGIVVLERAQSAESRGVSAIAAILGCGESADAHHLTQPHPQGEGAARAMTAALVAAKLLPTEISLVAAHATGTPDNDAGEFAALSRVFGEHLAQLPVVAFKSHLGHTLGGAGAVELILSTMALRDQTIPACVNVAADEVEFPNLCLAVGAPKRAPIGATLNTSLGFGGANTCIILGPPTPSHSIHALPSVQKQEVFITGIGVLFPGAVGNESFIHRLQAGSEAMPAWSRDAGAIDEAQFVHLLNARRVRRMSDYVKLTLAATTLACQDAGLNETASFADTCSAILGTTHGGAGYSHAYYRQIVQEGLIGANPMLFAEGVPNAGSAQLSLMLLLKGACQAIIGTRTAGLDALRLAALRIEQGEWSRAIVGAAEEYDAVINNAYQHCGVYAGRDGCAPFAGEKGFVTGSASVTFLLESRSSMEQRGMKPWGRILAGATARGGKPGDAVRDIVEQIGNPQFVLTSANGTWIDRAESAGLRQCGGDKVVSSLYGHFAESFSATPLAGIAAVLLSQRMPALLGDGLRGVPGLKPAAGAERPDLFAAICSDYAGSVSGISIAPVGRNSPAL
jgi:3-oxoacyl-[acyl-carrier-protein] synthase II